MACEVLIDPGHGSWGVDDHSWTAEIVPLGVARQIIAVTRDLSYSLLEQDAGVSVKNVLPQRQHH